MQTAFCKGQKIRKITPHLITLIKYVWLFLFVLDSSMTVYAEVPNLHHLHPDDLRWSWCNNNRNKVHVMCLNHPETISPPARRKTVFHETGPWCQKRLGTTVYSILYSNNILKDDYIQFLDLFSNEKLFLNSNFFFRQAKNSHLKRDGEENFLDLIRSL